MNKKRTAFNAIISSMQVIITGATFFLVYRYLLDQLGADLLGVWSLIVATSSIANLANFGLTSGLVKFVAEYNILGKQHKLYQLIFTAVVSTLILLIVATIIIFLLSNSFLVYFVGEKNINVALGILPFSLICLLLNTIGGIFTSVLEGFQKNYLRHTFYIIALIGFSLLCLLWVPEYGIYGVTYAQIVQSIIILLLSFIVAIRSHKIYPHTIKDIWGWNKEIFKNLFAYGSKFQIISACQMLLEPTTKMILSKFGGTHVVAYYEMAARLVGQIRALIVSANQVIVPVIAEKAAACQEQLKDIYVKTFRLILFIEVPMIVLLIICVPMISQIWIGHIEDTFVTLLYILASSSIVLILNGPAYFGILGEGKLNIMLITYSCMVISNLFFAYIFTIYMSPKYGAALGSALTSIISTIIMSIQYQKTHNISMKNVFARNEIILLSIGSLVACISIIANIYKPNDTLLVLLFNFLIYTILLSPITYIIGKVYLDKIYKKKKILK